MIAALLLIAGIFAKFIIRSSTPDPPILYGYPYESISPILLLIGLVLLLIGLIILWKVKASNQRS
jgi:hypothetical protein